MTISKPADRDITLSFIRGQCPQTSLKLYNTVQYEPTLLAQGLDAYKEGGGEGSILHGSKYTYDRYTLFRKSILIQLAHT